MHREETTTGFIEAAAKRPGADRFTPEEWASLKADADVLGLWGLMVAASLDEVPEADPEVRDELDEALSRDLADALGAEGSAPLGARMDEFLAAKGDRGPELLGRSVARLVHEVYDLTAHDFVQEDVLHAGSLLARGAPGQDARETAKSALRISRRSARSTLGHLDGQLELVHKLANEDVPVDYADLDERLGEYAPRLFAQRLPSLVKSLILEDRKFRFVMVMWARLRGVVIGRSHMIDLSDRIEPRDPLKLIEALMKRAEVRASLRRATETCPAATRIEEAFGVEA